MGAFCFACVPSITYVTSSHNLNTKFPTMFSFPLPNFHVFRSKGSFLFLISTPFILQKIHIKLSCEVPSVKFEWLVLELPAAKAMGVKHCIVC